MRSSWPFHSCVPPRTETVCFYISSQLSTVPLLCLLAFALLVSSCSLFLLLSSTNYKSVYHHSSEPYTLPRWHRHTYTKAALGPFSYPLLLAVIGIGIGVRLVGTFGCWSCCFCSFSYLPFLPSRLTPSKPRLTIPPLCFPASRIRHARALIGKLHCYMHIKYAYRGG